MLNYKIFAAAFFYPDEKFFEYFPQLLNRKEELSAEYDRLFRADEIWLYGTEYIAKNEFQRASLLSDIMGFYRAFGVEPDKDRPDSLSGELEFMHYLIFKRIHAEGKEKSLVTIDAEKKFFKEHLYPQAKEILRKIISKAKGTFYADISSELLEFLRKEKAYLGR